MVIETPPIPNDMVDLMKALAKQVIKDQPDNIYDYSAKFFEDLLIKRDGSLDKGYGKFRRYEKYCAFMDKMNKRPLPKSIAPSNGGRTNYDSTDSGISSGGDVSGHNSSLSLGGNEQQPIEVNGVAINAISRKPLSKTVRKIVSNHSKAANSLSDSSMVLGNECTSQTEPKPPTKIVRKLSSKRPPENLIVIAEETSTDVAESEEANRQTIAAGRIQRAFRRVCAIKKQEKKEIRAAEIIQKAYKLFVAKKISNFEVDGLKPLANHCVQLTTVEDTPEPILIGLSNKDSMVADGSGTPIDVIDPKYNSDIIDPVVNDDVTISQVELSSSELISKDNADNKSMSDVATHVLPMENSDSNINNSNTHLTEEDTVESDITVNEEHTTTIDDNQSTIIIEQLLSSSDDSNRNLEDLSYQENQSIATEHDIKDKDTEESNESESNTIETIITKGVSDEVTINIANVPLDMKINAEINEENDSAALLEICENIVPTTTKNVSLIDDTMTVDREVNKNENKASIVPADDLLIAIIDKDNETLNITNADNDTTPIALISDSIPTVVEINQELELKSNINHQHEQSKYQEELKPTSSIEMTNQDTVGDVTSNVLMIANTNVSELNIENQNLNVVDTTTDSMPVRVELNDAKLVDGNIVLDIMENNQEIHSQQDEVIPKVTDEFLTEIDQNAISPTNTIMHQDTNIELKSNGKEVKEYISTQDIMLSHDDSKNSEARNEILSENITPSNIELNSLQQSYAPSSNEHNFETELDRKSQSVPSDSYLELLEQSPRYLDTINASIENVSETDLDEDSNHQNLNKQMYGIDDHTNLESEQHQQKSKADTVEIESSNSNAIENVNTTIEAGTEDTHDIDQTISPPNTINTYETQSTLKKSPTVLRELSSLNDSPTFEKEISDDLTYLSTENTSTPPTRLPSPCSPISQTSSVPTPDSEQLSVITVVEAIENTTSDIDSLPVVNLDNQTLSVKAEAKQDENIVSLEVDDHRQDLHTLVNNNVEQTTDSIASFVENQNDNFENIGENVKKDNPENQVIIQEDPTTSVNEPATPVKEPTASNPDQIEIGHNPQQDNLGEFVDPLPNPPPTHSIANLIQNVFQSPRINRITEDDESDNTSTDENYPVPNTDTLVDTTQSIPYEPLLSSDLSETDEVQIRRCGNGDYSSCVDETSRDELDELSEVENVDLTSFGEDSLEAMYYRIRKDEILLDKSRKLKSAEKIIDAKKEAYEAHGISEQPTDVSNLEEDSSKENNLYDQHGVSEQLTTDTSNYEEDKKCNSKPMKNLNPVEYAIEQQRVLIDKLHHGSVNYEDVVTPLEDPEEDDQYPDSLNIRRNMWASSMSETDSDYVDMSAHRLTRDDFNISTALDHMSSSESGSTIVSAATKIQAGARGFLTRRRIRRSSGDGTSAASVDKTCSFGNAAIDKSLDDLIEQQELLTMDEAVVKLQRFYRMYRQRKRQTEKQHRLILAHDCDDSQCPDVGEDEDQNHDHFQEENVSNVFDVRVEQKKFSEAPIEICKSEKSESPHLPKIADKEIIEQSEFDQHQPALNDVFEPVKIAPSDAQRAWSPDNQHMSIDFSSAGDSFEMDSLQHQRRRLTLQRGDAVQRYSSPDESSPQDITQTSATITASNIGDIPSSSSVYGGLSPSTQNKSKRKLLGVRQNSMPVQIDSDLIRIIPKHLRKRIKSADSASRKDLLRNHKF